MNGTRYLPSELPPAKSRWMVYSRLQDRIMALVEAYERPWTDYEAVELPTGFVMSNADTMASAVLARLEEHYMSDVLARTTTPEIDWAFV